MAKRNEQDGEAHMHRRANLSAVIVLCNFHLVDAHLDEWRRHPFLALRHTQPGVSELVRLFVLIVGFALRGKISTTVFLAQEGNGDDVLSRGAGAAGGDSHSFVCSLLR